MVLVEILIVEDERLVGFDLRRRLSRMGYTVVGITASGEEAIEHANRLRPDIVLCLLGLPGMDGYAVASALRRDPSTAAARLALRADIYACDCLSSFPWTAAQALRAHRKRGQSVIGPVATLQARSCPATRPQP